ncbi:hypothetical protein BWI15_00305 [Kribbella sp. ALI-6-A]|uniref:hypothetical protein n=1 Tax=Kribbella sp. ALI-6-A TaxID=1933817 RepID=UPI00097C9B73|nr:hypothetical protein [Kribbella sp. ALI-6-A]ONI79054.1 hypothetical protein BWI15_00305 [Kribbella sp. ALI-6-A]
MLDSIETQFRRRVGNLDPGPALPPRFLTPRVHLYAPKAIQILWSDVLDQIEKADEVWLDAECNGEVPGGPLTAAYERAELLLAEGMSEDLRVPGRWGRIRQTMRWVSRRQIVPAEPD